VFDVDGRLRHHAEKPVTRDRVRETLEFLSSIADTSLVRSEPTDEDRLRVRSARAPFVAAIDGDRVEVRTNPAARCGARAPLGETD
jgi:hypothetical protein